MEALTEVLKKLKISPNELNTKCIQEVLILTKKIDHLQENYQVWSEIAEVLWLHLQTGFEKFDDQLLCATCFYSVLHLTDKEELYLEKIIEIVENERHCKETETKSSKTTLVVSLMYGMFQSSFLSQTKTCIKSLLNTIFKLLVAMAYEYTKFTFIVFKTISSFKKVMGTDLQECLFSKENNIILLNLVNHNWENPITGIRDLNKIIFQTLIMILDVDLFETMLKEVNSFYWNKAKYLMLAEIISKKEVPLQDDWVDGAAKSLSKPGLVSAGTDMYFAILNRCKSEEEWCNVIMKHLTEILNSTSQKTVQNFSNYWCLTTLKLFPNLFEKFMAAIENDLDEKTKLFNSLTVVKQAHKLGLVSMDDLIRKQDAVIVIENGLCHCNDQIRIMAFNILCSMSKLGGDARIQNDDILFYLITNINSDNTVLRINMLNSISNNLNSKQNDLNTFKESEPGELEREIRKIKSFSKKIQKLVIDNLEIQGNYQRKLTNIKLAHIFMNDWANTSKKKKQNREGSVNVVQLLKDDNLWMLHNKNVIENVLKLLNDPAEDIRDNVVQLLLEYYATQLRDVSTFNLLINNALKSMSSKFFYDISCGKSAFKLIINLLLQETHPDGTFQTVTDIFEFAYSQIITEHSSNRTIIESIEQGKQLHSYMTILHTVLEECLKHDNKIAISNEKAIQLLVVLEEISNQFVWDEDTDTSSDFSKMSDMINDLIKSSGYKCEGKDDTTISGMHQLVLNCLWLNVKAACDLSSMLIKYQNNEPEQLDICSKALDIMSHVLETCRHKGAIESAGAALGQSFQHLTSLPEGTKISTLPFVYLESKLNDLISVTGRMASVTRRGAGLSIMVHRIVSSDIKKGKPLFHYFMNTILETCNQVEDVPKILNDVQNVENEKDLPKAIYIHFLTRIVTDSSLASDMMFYSAELAALAFGNLTSPHWQIRNAALQLYGALVQKLIGQKKAAGTDDETIATVACDELRTHSPKLWAMITKRLQTVDFNDRLQYLSSLVPILNMLANMARRYNFSSDFTVQTQADTDLLRNLMDKLDSPIYTVRRLTAKSIFNIYSFHEVYLHLVEQKCFTENNLHGSLMLIANYHKLHGTESKFEAYFVHLNLKYCNIFNSKNQSYLCREIYEDLFYNGDESIKYIEETFVELDSKSHAPGIYSWAYKRIQKFLYNSSWDLVPDFLKVILERDEFDIYCEILIEKAEKLGKVEMKIVNNILAVTLLSERKYRSGVLWKFLYNITFPYSEADLSRFYNLLVNDCSSYLIKNMHNSSLVYNLRYMIPIAAKMFVVDIPKVILLLTDSETTDVEMRMIAAKAITELATGGFDALKHRHVSDVVSQMVMSTLYCLTILLQDEDEDVRKLSAYSFAKFQNFRASDHWQPYICLLNILQHIFLEWCIDESSIPHFLSLLSDYSMRITKSKTIDKNNPFANKCHNIYFEENVLSQLIENVKMRKINIFLY